MSFKESFGVLISWFGILILVTFLSDFSANAIINSTGITSNRAKPIMFSLFFVIYSIILYYSFYQ